MFRDQWKLFPPYYILASITPAICLIGVCLSGCKGGAVVPLMVIATTSMGPMFSGVFSNQNDLASNYAGNVILTTVKVSSEMPIIYLIIPNIQNND